MGKAKQKQEMVPGCAGIEKRHRMVPNPDLTDAQFYHVNGEELDRVSRTGATPNPNVGKTPVVENAMSRIGALCYIKQRTDVQEKAAECFKVLYESLYGAQPAMDLANPVVDRSIVAHDAGMATRVDRGRKMDEALRKLGRTAFNRIVATVCMGISFRDLHWKQKTREIQALLDSLDEISVLWDLQPRSRG